MIRKQYLKQHRKATYVTLLTSCKRISHLKEIDDGAKETFGLFAKQMQEREGITEALKAQEQMARIKAVNSIRN